MTSRKIDLRLFPGVDCAEKKAEQQQATDNVKNVMLKKCLDIPLMKAYTELLNNKRVLIVGSASFGKSSSLKVFEAVSLVKGIPCLFYDCKNLSLDVISSIVKRVKRAEDCIFIFDAFDMLEAELKDPFGKMIEKLSTTDSSVIISSRFYPFDESVTEGGYEYLKGFAKIQICPFTDSELDMLVGDHIDRKSGYYMLLKNPMFLSIHLELENRKRAAKMDYKIKKEVEFIKQYFNLLSSENDPEALKPCDFVHLGEYIHKQRNNKSIRFPERIPRELRHIFYYSKKINNVSKDCEMKFLDSVQQKYLNYAHGEYLYDKILRIVCDSSDEEAKAELAKLLDVDLTYNGAESFYYCGQLIGLMNEEELLDIKEKLEDCKVWNVNQHKNRIFILCGATNDIDDDMKGRMSSGVQMDMRLFPDVVSEGRVFSLYDAENKEMKSEYLIPLVRAYLELPDKKRMFVVARASHGKSTSLRMLEETMLSMGVDTYFYKFEKFNVKEDIKSIYNQILAEKKGLVIFDAVDELGLEAKDEFYEMISSLSETDVSIVIAKQSEDFDNSFIFKRFSKFSRVYIKPFSFNQIEALLGEHISKVRGSYSVLQTTMFMNIFLKLLVPVKSEAQLIHDYFCKLYSDASRESERERDIWRLGRYLHKNRIYEEGRIEEAVPAPLRSIFVYHNKKTEASVDGEGVFYLNSSHKKYLNYLHGEYIFQSLRAIAQNIENKEACCSELAELLDITSTREVSEAMHYAGQLTELLEEEERRNIIKLLGYRSQGILKNYENLLCIFLGANNDVADDVEGLFEFYSPVMEDRRFGFIFVCDRIRVLKAESLKDIRFCVEGLPNLERIIVENEVFRSENNCLIKKRSSGLVLGCQNSVIPNGVAYIAGNAFSYCSNLKKIIVPPSVNTVDRMAFKHCTDLEYVEIGEGVTVLSREAFYGCTAIKTIRLMNPQMEIKNGKYTRGAFGRISGLESATIPTQAIHFLMGDVYGDIQKLAIYQGKRYPDNISLTFQEINNTHIIKNLYIHKDVEKISGEAFYKFNNHLESIVVEKENRVYSSENNCLINKKEGKNNAVILGCKNSRIPTESVRRLKSHCFENCNGIVKMVIPDNIVEIGEKVFNQCTMLDTVEIGTGIVSIKEGAFRSCIRLKRVIVSDINRWAQVSFGEAASSSPAYLAKSIEYNGFKDGSLELQEGITSINIGVFKRCQNIKSVHMPRSVKRIMVGAFDECYQIEAVYTKDLASWLERIYESPTSNPLCYGAGLYVGNERAVNVVIGDDVSNVSRFSMAKCGSLESVTFNSPSVTVEASAFKGCPRLKEIRFNIVPKAVDKNAFEDCQALLILKGSADEWQDFASGLNGIIGIRYTEEDK
ncbi:MAG: leucine-rich repeat domain-containing protein [Ruminococcaceae bacterium]|nr:leucine-rich repeat domain-containing protein [Oscillospiraceae bacterium]